MWPFKAKPMPTATKTSTAVLEAPKPSVMTLPTADVPDGYKELANRLRIVNRGDGRVDQPFKKWLIENGIPIYSADAVEKWLGKVFGKNTRNDSFWVWRTATMPEHSDYGRSSYIRTFRFANGIIGGYFSGGNPHLFTTYNKPIPMPVLLTMERIGKQFHNAKFFISDESSEAERIAIRDPFLLVVVDDEAYCVERWDEPGFRGLE